MNKEQQHFVNEMLRHADKKQAYRSAYPDAKTDKAVESSVNRLLKNKKVKAAIDEPTKRMRAEAEAELKERMQGELLDFYECQKTLAQIVRGQYTTTKQVRVKDGFDTIEVKPTVSNVLGALNQFFRLNNHYPQKKTAEDRKAEKAAAAREISEKWMREERPKLPAWPTNNPFRHPWGDIYPPEYKGPFYDPKDPNTREQFLAITEPYRLSKLAKEKEAQNSQQNTTTHNNPSPLPSLRGGSATWQSHDNTGEHSIREIATSLCCASVPRNDEKRENSQQNTTTGHSELMSTNEKDNLQRITHNNIQHQTSNIQHLTYNNTTTHNNTPPPEPTLEEQIAIKYKHTGPKVRQTMLRYALEKEGWMTIQNAFFMVHDIHMRHQHSGTQQMMKNFEKAKNARNHPPHLRLPIEKETGWAIHPKYPNMMKRTRSLGW